jgi:hypothetical protein
MSLSKTFHVIILFLVVNASAQTAAPAQSTGPTLEETVAFLNEAFQREGRAFQIDSDTYLKVTNQKVVQQAPCVLTYSYQSEHQNSLGIERLAVQYRISLDRLDPMSVSQDHPMSYYQEIVLLNASYHGTSNGGPPDGNPELGYFMSKTLATRVSKAWIHAMVLCGAKGDPF